MNPHKLSSLFSFLIVISSLTAYAPANAIELSIYSTATPGEGGMGWNDTIPGYAFVIDHREIDLKKGLNNIRLTQIPASLDPTSVQFQSLSNPAETEILTQEYRFDLANNQTLLNRYLGKNITVEQIQGSGIGSTTGTLLSTVNGITLQDKNSQIITLNNYSAIRFPTIANDSPNVPTLSWDIAAKTEGLHKIEIRYQAKGISWWADYNATFEEGSDPNLGTLEINSWVSVINKTGMDIENANLKLIAGNIHSTQAPRYMARPNMMMTKMADSAAPEGFTEKSLFEYHMYTLKEKINLANNTVKQIQFLPKLRKIPVEKQYIYEGTLSQFAGYTNTDQDTNTHANTKINVYLKWKNSEAAGLGIPLPTGRIRISAVNTSNPIPEFIGEDIIDHTAKDAEIQVKMGSAFDLTADKKQINFSLDNNRHIIEETFEITLKNHKDKDVNIMVKENLYRAANWEILKKSSSFEKVNSSTIKFPIVVKANNETKVQYTVRYTW